MRTDQSSHVRNLKRDARRLAKERGVKLSQAMAAIAVARGHADWGALLRADAAARCGDPAALLPWFVPPLPLGTEADRGQRNRGRTGVWFYVSTDIAAARGQLTRDLVAIEAEVDKQSAGRPDEIVSHLCTWSRPAGARTAVVGDAAALTQMGFRHAPWGRPGERLPVDETHWRNEAPVGERTFRHGRCPDGDQWPPRRCAIAELRENPEFLVLASGLDAELAGLVSRVACAHVVLVAMAAPSPEEGLSRYYGLLSEDREFACWTMADDLAGVVFADGAATTVLRPDAAWRAACLDRLRQEERRRLAETAG
jgi:hypothetical protein